MRLSGILSRRGEYIQLVEVLHFSHQTLCVGFYFSVLDEGKDWGTAIGETLLGIGIQDLFVLDEGKDWRTAIGETLLRIRIQDLLEEPDAWINVGLTTRNKTSWLRLLVLNHGSWWNHGNSGLMALKREDGTTF